MSDLFLGETVAFALQEPFKVLQFVLLRCLEVLYGLYKVVID